MYAFGRKSSIVGALLRIVIRVPVLVDLGFDLRISSLVKQISFDESITFVVLSDTLVLL